MERRPDGLLTVNMTNGVIDEVSTLIWAVGRLPQTRSLNLNYAVCFFSILLYLIFMFMFLLVLP